MANPSQHIYTSTPRRVCVTIRSLSNPNVLLVSVYPSMKSKAPRKASSQYRDSSASRSRIKRRSTRVTGSSTPSVLQSNVYVLFDARFVCAHPQVGLLHQRRCCYHSRVLQRISSTGSQVRPTAFAKPESTPAAGELDAYLNIPTQRSRAHRCPRLASRPKSHPLRPKDQYSMSLCPAPASSTIGGRYQEVL
jgi:hypothetical protein